MISLRSHNDFYIVDCTDSNFSALGFYFHDDKIILDKLAEAKAGTDFETFLRQLKPGRNSKVIFVYNNPMGATFAGQVKLEKNNHNAPLNNKDLDLFLTTAVEQFFNRFREEAKRKLESDDVGVVLANNRFLNFKLDGSAVISPLGLKGKSAELEMEQTFVARKFINHIHDCLPEVKNIFHIELSGAARDSISRLYPDEKTLLAIVKDKETDVWTYGTKPRYFGAVSFAKAQERGRFAWGLGNIIKSLTAHLKLDEKTARLMLTLYANGGMSKSAKRGFEKVIHEPQLAFREEMKKLYKKETAVLVLSRVPFFSMASDPEIPFRALAFNDLLRGYNLEIEAPESLKKESLSPVFPAALIAYLNRTGDNYLNVLSRERMKWMIPLNSA